MNNQPTKTDLIAEQIAILSGIGYAEERLLANNSTLEELELILKNKTIKPNNQSNKILQYKRGLAEQIAQNNGLSNREERLLAQNTSMKELERLLTENVIIKPKVFRTSYQITTLGNSIGMGWSQIKEFTQNHPHDLVYLSDNEVRALMQSEKRY